MKKKQFNLHFVQVGTQEQSNAIVKQLARGAIHKVLDQHGVISPNLDEVLDKYIIGDVR
ncbi:hypothetical protein [Paenibacillus stellifer]|uniref:hypothetical protein n=1 Tax=Paenibacillus stellifer TaxID=169760 RepID=UPI000A84EE74|nr:hypothetical protein [Paenibacillus stellifer]